LKGQWRDVAVYSAMFAIFATALVLYRPEQPDNYVDHHEAEPGVMMATAPRSPQWRTVRNRYIKDHPACEACGSTEDLNVHHILPFSTHPELELVESNLISLCRSHHLSVGHVCEDGRRNWGECSNPNVRRDAARIRNEGKW
jgi:hypothetical protein